MKAVVKTAAGEGNVAVWDVPEPETPAGHVKIAVRAAGVCGTDIHILHGEFRTQPPVVMGHEVSGEVVEIGEGVSSVAVGDRVTSETYFSTCGACRYCRDGRINLCPQRRSIGSAVDGAFTRYLIVPERNVHLLPNTVSFEAGALTEPLACVVHGALELTRLMTGDLAVIAGPGAIGLLTLQVARAAGARTVMLGTPVDAQRLETAAALGAEAVFDVTEGRHAAAIADLTDGAGADVVYECSGAEAAAQTLLDLVRRGGQYTQIGLFGKPIRWDLEQICYKEIAVTGSNASVPSAWRRALTFLSNGTVRTAPLISGIYPVTEWRDAFDAFERRNGLKVLLQPAEGGR